MSKQEQLSSQPADPKRTPIDTYCGHFSSLTKARFNQLFNRVAAVRAANDDQNDIGTADDSYPDLFEFTHQPITVYETGSDVTNERTKQVSEREILSKLQEPHVKNFAVIIQGNTGTGKSELCSYLIHQLQDTRPLLEVRKSDSLMTLVTERIPQFYESELGKEFPEQVSYEEIEKSLCNPSEDIPGLITRKATTLLNRDGHTLSPDTDHAAIQSFLNGKMHVLMKGVEEQDEGTRLITSSEYKQKEFLQIFESETDIPEYDVLNNALWNALLDEFDTPPLETVLEMVGEEFTDVRPVMVFEDFSIAAVQAQQLSNFIDRDQKGDPWDFVIAGTTDSIRPLRTQTLLARYPFYQTNSPDSNQVPFLTNENVVEFVRPYLAYPKTHDGSVKYTRPNDSNRLLEITGVEDSETICGDCGLCTNPLDRTLFPLTATFINRIFDPGLEPSERSPRELIRILEEVLDETYYGPTTIPSSASVLEGLTSNIVPHDSVWQNAEEFVSLAQWYGGDEGDVWEVDRRIPDSFNLLDDYQIDSLPATLPGGVVVTADAVKIPKIDYELDDIEVDDTTEKNDPDDDEAGDADDDVDSDSRHLSTVERIMQERRGTVNNWRNNPGREKFKETGDFISAAIEDLLEILTTNYSFWPESNLRYKTSDAGRPFVFSNTDEAPDPGQIVIDPKSFRVSSLFKLLEHGIRLKHGSPDRDEILDNHSTHFTSLAVRWQTRARESFIYNDDLLFSKKKQNSDFDDFVVSTYAAICLIEDPWKPITADRLNERFADSDDFTFDTSLQHGLSDGVVPAKDVEKLKQFLEMGDCVESLLSERFGVTRNQLNIPALRRHLGNNPLSVLNDLARSRIDKVDWRVQFSDADETQLRNLAKAAHDTYSTLDDVQAQITTDSDSEVILARLDGVTIDDVRGIRSTIKTSFSDLARPEFIQLLDNLSKFEDADLEELREGAKAVSGVKYDYTGKVRQSLGLVKLRAHPITSLLEEVFDESRSTTDAVAPSFQEVAKYYVGE